MDPAQPAILQRIKVRKKRRTPSTSTREHSKKGHGPGRRNPQTNQPLSLQEGLPDAPGRNTQECSGKHPLHSRKLGDEVPTRERKRSEKTPATTIAKKVSPMHPCPSNIGNHQVLQERHSEILELLCHTRGPLRSARANTILSVQQVRVDKRILQTCPPKLRVDLLGVRARPNISGLPRNRKDIQLPRPSAKEMPNKGLQVRDNHRSTPMLPLCDYNFILPRRT